jgi:hypothetical protein
MAIIVYNRQKETHSDSPNNFRIYRPYVLSNPYTHLPLEKTKAIYKVPTREDAVKAYDHYFDLMYRSNLKFKRVVDLIYEKYKAGEDVYLECCCKPAPCHGDIIKEKLEKRLLKEKISEMKGAEAK